MILNILYWSFFGSFLLAPLKKEVDEIMCNSELAKVIEDNHSSMLQSEYKLIGVSTDTYVNHVFNANVSYGYFINHVIWNYNFGSGKGAILNLFRRLGPFQKKTVVNSLIIRESSEFRDDMEDFMLKMWCFGFINKFSNSGHDVKVNFSSAVVNSKENNYFSFQEFSSVLKFVAFGWIFGVITFIGELVVKFIIL